MYEKKIKNIRKTEKNEMCIENVKTEKSTY